MSPTAHDPLQNTVELLRYANSALFVTGAGVSADSGLPTYRGIGGLYSENGGMTEDGIPIEEALSGAFFEQSPAVTWKYLLQIEHACRDAKPNRAHEVMALLEEKIRHVCIFTQNVDGLHRAAGSTDVIDIHGDVHFLYCTTCGKKERVNDYSHLPPLPTCTDCGGIIRPDVVLFGELLPEGKLNRFQSLLQIGFDVILSVGTSSLFPYIMLPVYEGKLRGIPTVEINPGETELSSLVDHRIKAGAAETLGAIWDAMKA